MPNGNLKVPVSDAEEAMRIVRRNAQNLNVNPKDVGIMEFSAGGHLVSTIAIHSKGDVKAKFPYSFLSCYIYGPKLYSYSYDFNE